MPGVSDSEDCAQEYPGARASRLVKARMGNVLMVHLHTAVGTPTEGTPVAPFPVARQEGVVPVLVRIPPGPIGRAGPAPGLGATGRGVSRMMTRFSMRPHCSSVQGHDRSALSYIFTGRDTLLDRPSGPDRLLMVIVLFAGSRS